MKLKSLLIGSAAVMAVSTGGAKAADAIVMAEPEPMEYVRICDVYGTGFFYIPGTETCLRIGGQMRFETRFDVNGVGVMDWFSRFQLNVDVRNETEWGTVRGYAEGRFDYGRMAFVTYPAGVATTTFALGSVAYLNQGFIELITASGTLRLGKSDAPYARFLGYGLGGGPFDGTYAFSNSNEISFQFNGSNGFAAIIALMEDGDFDYVPDIEGGIRFTQGWGMVGIQAGYDESAATWGAKGVLRYNAPNGSVSAGLLVMYSSGAGRYAIVDPGAGVLAPWSAAAYVKGNFTATAAAFLQAQWFSGNGAWEFAGGLDLKPVSGLRIRPEVRYRTSSGAWAAIARFDRDF
jgi:hypothetical protein